MQTRFILVQPLLVPTSRPQATYSRFFTISINPLQTLNTPWNPSPLYSKILHKTICLLITILTLQETISLLITIDFSHEQKDFSSPDLMIQIEVPRGISF